MRGKYIAQLNDCTKLSTGNSCGSAKALERSRGDLSGPTTALGQYALCARSAQGDVEKIRADTVPELGLRGQYSDDIMV